MNPWSFGRTGMIRDDTYLLSKTLGVKYNIVSLKGGKAVLDAITAGDIDIGWVAGIQGKGIASGDLVNLASGEATRLKMSPNAPTVKELGLDIDFGIYFMFIAPKGLPVDAREALSNAMKEIINDPSSKTNGFITKTFGPAVTLSGAELEKFVVGELVSSKKMLEDASK